MDMKKVLDGHDNNLVKASSFSELAESSLGSAPSRCFWDTHDFQPVHINSLRGATGGQQWYYLTYSNNSLLILKNMSLQVPITNTHFPWIFLCLSCFFCWKV